MSAKNRLGQLKALFAFRCFKDDFNLKKNVDILSVDILWKYTVSAEFGLSWKLCFTKKFWNQETTWNIDFFGSEFWQKLVESAQMPQKKIFQGGPQALYKLALWKFPIIIQNYYRSETY